MVAKLEAEEDPTSCFSLLGQEDAATCHRSGLVRLWQCGEEGEPQVVRTFRSIHTGPIAVCHLHRLATTGGRLLATGGTDGSVKVWDLEAQYYTHNLRAPGGGVATTVVLHPTKLLLYAGFASGGLFCWDLTTSKLVATLEAHHSTVTGLALAADGSRAVSCGRDGVAVVWDLASHTKVTTVPVFGPAEGVLLLEDSLALLAVGSTLSTWNLAKAKQLDKLELGSEVTLLRPSTLPATAHCATADLNLVTVTTGPKLAVSDTVVGNNDEVLDLAYLGEASSHLVLACNSPSLRLYTVASWRCSLASGHRDTVLCLATCPRDPSLLATGSKDREVRLWRLEGDSLACLVVGSGHTEALGGMAFSPEDGSRLYTVSKDTTLKVWTLNMEEGKMASTRTEIAHEKDINCVAVSQGGGEGLVCTGGQDKVAKLWSKDLQLVHILRGHNRGIWTAAFSPADRLVATGSGDSCVRLWSLGEGSCVKQLEGHSSSVLRLAWGPTGTQVITQIVGCVIAQGNGICILPIVLPIHRVSLPPSISIP